MRRALLLLASYSAAALVLTILGGVRHDYIYYLEQWQLVRAGLDPWSTNNAYGPLHNAFALLVPLHPLAPKLLTAAGLLAANTLLVLALLVTPAAAALRVAADPLVVSLLSMVFAVVSIVGGILLALGAAIPISPYVTTISFVIYLVCRGIGHRRGRIRTADVGFRP